jgi:cytochrome b
MIWDLPIRIFHWLLVLSICGSFITIQNDWMLAHERCGLTILGLLIFRLIWGVVGYPTARFVQFVKGPRAIVAYIKQLIGNGKTHSFGHNPLGALSVIALLSVILFQALSGTLSTDDIFYDGPLYHVFPAFTKFAGSLHQLLPLLILSLIGLHLVAIITHRIFFKEKLTSQMITGKTHSEEIIKAQSKAAPLTGLALMAICISASWSLTLLN